MRLVLPLLIIFSPGCFLFASNPSGDPCSDDALGCDDGEVFEVDVACEENSPLILELGNGDGVFESLAPGVAPTAVQGPQGGSHLVLGVGIDNPLETHLMFELTVSLRVYDGGETWTLAERTAVYDESVVEFEARRADLLNFVLVPDGDTATMGLEIEVFVQDTCGRAGRIVHTVGA